MFSIPANVCALESLQEVN